MLGRPERERRGRAEGGDRGQLIRRLVGGGDERAEQLTTRRQDQHAAQDRVDLMEAVLQTGHDPEVPAGAAERPEQVSVSLLVNVEQLASPSELTQQVIDRQTMLAKANDAVKGDL